jgi:hypothetical protein
LYLGTGAPGVGQRRLAAQHVPNAGGGYKISAVLPNQNGLLALHGLLNGGAGCLVHSGQNNAPKNGIA